MLHAYQLGDLDDFFWPYTSWFRRGNVVALLYHGADPPTLLAFAAQRELAMLSGLLSELSPVLPARCWAHLSPGAEVALARRFQVASGGAHQKMALTDPVRLDAARPAGDPLTGADLPELRALYEAAYPGNWFDARMVETGQYVGVRRAGELVAVAGVHVWSPTYRVAALGNVTTHPRVRGQGLAGAVVAALCRRLRRSVDHLTLNVKSDNVPALRVYGRLGFTRVADYGEYALTARGAALPAGS